MVRARHGDIKFSQLERVSSIGGDNLTGGVLSYTGGAVIWTELIGAGRSTGGSSRGTDEWILDANTGYIFEVISGATSTAINIVATWYEHTDG